MLLAVMVRDGAPVTVPSPPVSVIPTSMARSCVPLTGVARVSLYSYVVVGTGPPLARRWKRIAATGLTVSILKVVT
ncbi:MAG: hypothetical protein EBU70_13440 [Actinobacteria bacterium]|nr:hypothetical protein [Actinomycetota bacterium]